MCDMHAIAATTTRAAEAAAAAGLQTGCRRIGALRLSSTRATARLAAWNGANCLDSVYRRGGSLGRIAGASGQPMVFSIPPPPLQPSIISQAPDGGVRRAARARAQV